MASITEAELTRAIERTLVVHGKMTADQAHPTARMVLGYFGAEGTVLDNKLSSEDRDRFYQLEEEGLLTSEEDYFREAVTRTSQAWRAAGVPHEFEVAAGPHDYVFNRGPGSLEPFSVASIEKS